MGSNFETFLLYFSTTKLPFKRSLPKYFVILRSVQKIQVSKFSVSNHFQDKDYIFFVIPPLNNQTFFFKRTIPEMFQVMTFSGSIYS